jgi:hypothetical protein
MLHDRRLPLRVPADLEAAEHAPVTEVDDLRGASSGNHAHRDILAPAAEQGLVLFLATRLREVQMALIEPA